MSEGVSFNMVFKILVLACLVCMSVIPLCNILLIAMPLFEAYAFNRLPEVVRIVLVADSDVIEVDEVERVVRIAVPQSREVVLRYSFSHRDDGVKLLAGGVGDGKRDVIRHVDVDGIHCVLISQHVGEVMEMRVKLLDDRCTVTINVMNLPVSAKYRGVRYGVYEVDDYLVLDLHVADVSESTSRAVELPVFRASFREISHHLISMSLFMTVVMVAYYAMFLFFIRNENMAEMALAFVATSFMMMVIAELILLRIAF